MQNYNHIKDDLSSDITPSQIKRFKILAMLSISVAIIFFMAGLLFWAIFGPSIINALK